jgi:hypothetical protein
MMQVSNTDVCDLMCRNLLSSFVCIAVCKGFGMSPVDDNMIGTIFTVLMPHLYNFIG